MKFWWMKSNELVVAENWKFESRSISIYRALFGTFELSRICCMDQNKRFFNWIVLRKRKNFDGGVGEIITVVTEEFVFDYRYKSIILNISCFFWPLELWRKDQKYWFSIEPSSKKVRLSIGISTEKIRFIVVEKCLKIDIIHYKKHY